MKSSGHDRRDCNKWGRKSTTNLVRRVLADPVRVQHTQVGRAASDALLGDGAERALELQLVDTLVLRLAVHNALGVRSLAATAANAGAEDHIALLSLVSEAASLVDARRAGRAVDDGQLTET